MEAKFGSKDVVIWENYVTESNIVQYVSPGTQMRVIGDANGEWLLVRLENGSEGWVKDSEVSKVDITTFSMPTQEKPTNEPASSCPGAPPQRVRIGETVTVCTAHDKLIVRTQPKRGASEVTRLDTSTQVAIIDGPICADDWSWWEIETDSGIVGWVSEGGDEVDPYFICPAE
ncbi:MAG: SH3 domain-containing protein [Anaerolineae bacterium]|nr:SH3 domain-containing protein [Anaerolineae bacterium]